MSKTEIIDATVKRYLGFFLLAVVIFIPSQQIRASQNEQTSYGNQNISGYVTFREDIPPGSLRLSLYSAKGNFPGVPTEIVFPDSTGFFSFNSAARPPYLISIDGDEGTGRVFFAAGEHAGKINFTYPVTEKIVILHTNDQHFTMNHPEELAGKIDEIRNSYNDVYLMSAGDVFVRHPLRWIVNGRLMTSPGWYGERTMQMITAMNELGYDLMTPGNHEFAYREPYTRIALEAARFPLLAANIEITTDALPQLQDFAFLVTSTWRQIAVLGLSTINAGREGIRELDVSETVKRNLFLREEADVLVALTHIGLRRDRELAGEFPEIDLIVGGHSHDLLEEAETVNSVLITHAGGNPHVVSDSHPLFLGKIVLTLENGRVVDKRGHLIRILPANEKDTEEQTVRSAVF